MKHLQDIRSYIVTLLASTKLHALVVVSPPGWGKSSIVEEVLNHAKAAFRSLGSYSTPLAFYNGLCTDPTMTLVLDDSVGLLANPAGLSLLKSATWSSAGSQGARRVTWTSTSTKVDQPFVDFTGKLILLTNVVPESADVAAFMSRALPYRISLDRELITDMLKTAAKSRQHYEDENLATEVADYIIEQLDRIDWSGLNLRSLEMAYELAKLNRDNWKDLLIPVLPGVSPEQLVSQLMKSEMTSTEQEKEFIRVTGLSRRSFFNYRKVAGIGQESR